VKHPGAVAGWLFVILLMVLMLVWAAKESAASAAFVGTCLGLLIIVPLLVRNPKQ
jgi:hypothetical protein